MAVFSFVFALVLVYNNVVRLLTVSLMKIDGEARWLKKIVNI
jgi:hypothetical protein